MKKVFISILTLCALAASAQNEETTETTLETSSSSTGIKDALLENSNKELSFTSKNGFEVLPQKGDWGIGISASNPLNFAQSALSDGNGTATFSSANGTSTTQNGAGGVTVSGKFFKSSFTAYRGFLSVQTDRVTTLTSVADLGNPAEPGAFLQDKSVTKDRGISLGFGLEKRRGSGRVIGVYGAQAALGFGHGTITNYEYANELQQGNGQTSLDGTAGVPGSVVGDQRILKQGATSDVLIGAQVFLGVEYFIAPKISIGGEFNFGVRYNPSASSYNEYEYFNTNTNEVTEYIDETKGDNNVSSGTGSLGSVIGGSAGGNINMFFYF